MEKLKPVIGKSSISSLKFQKKSDFDKFLNFIKKQTKELEGIEKPKDDRLKSILKTGAIGLGIIGIGALLGRGKQGESGDDFGFAIGRRSNKPSTQLKSLPKETPRTTINKKQFRGAKGTRTFSGETSAKVTDLRKSGRTITKEFYTKKGVLSKVGETVEKKIEEGQKGTGDYKRGSRSPMQTKQIFSIPDPTPEEIKAQEKIVKQYIKNQKVKKRINNNTNQDYIKDAKKLNEELKKSKSTKRVIRPKKLFDISKRVDPLELIERQAIESSDVRKLVEEQSGTKIRDFKPQRKLIKDRFTNKITRPGVNTFSKPDPFNRYNVVDNPMLSKNPYKRGFLSNIFKSKVTRDTIMGIPTKGKFFTKAGMFFKHPIVSGISFLLTLYEGYREGKDIVNFKDNIITRIYDLGVAINNELIHPDDPSQMKLFLSESSNDKIRAKEIIRNQKILELKKQQLQQNGGNNILIVPTNNQTEGVKTTVPVPTSNNEVVIPPTKPLNIGENILLKKLDR